MNIAEIAEDIKDEFDMFDEWMDKYEHIISMGKELPIIEDKYRTEDYLVKGCQSQVWLSSEVVDGKIVFKADSDAVITKGIIALLVRVLSNHPASDIANADLGFIDKIGLKEHLSPNRSNGLVSMLKQMKMYAVAHLAQNN
jgi:cysteine desulfuration protein SufE